MKKLLLSLSLLTSLLSFGQITLDSTHMAGIGWVIQEARDTVPTVTPGNSGASQTWDLSGLNTHTLDSMTFTNPAWTTNGGDFTNANLAIYNHGDTTTMYLDNNYNEALMLGLSGDIAGTGTEMSIVFDDPSTFTKWPMNFQDTYADSSSFDFTFYIGQGPGGPDSVRFKQFTESVVDVDGWGDVTTPLGTFDALRTYTITFNTDSIWLWFSFGGWTFFQEDVYSTYQYSWYSDDPSTQFPVVTMEVDDQDSVQSVNWLATNPTFTTIKEHSPSNLIIYPNPANHTVTVELDMKDESDYQFLITDMMGRQHISSSENSINIDQLSAGYYTVSILENGQLIAVEPFIVE